MTDLCAEVEALLEELALGALPLDQERRLRAHLAGCPRHPMARELLVAGAAIAFEPEPVAPPAPLRERVLAMTGPGRTARPSRYLRRVAIAAAALVLVVAGTGTWYVVRDGPSGAVLIARGVGEGGSATIELREWEGEVTVTIEGLRPPPAGMAYQLWLVQGDVWLPLTTFLPDRGGRWSGSVSRPFLPGDWFCVTLESADGSAWPTSAPVLAVTVDRR